MDVFQIISNKFLGMLWATVVNDQVSGGSNRYLVRDVSREDELTIIPSDLDLDNVSLATLVS